MNFPAHTHTYFSRKERPALKKKKQPSYQTSALIGNICTYLVKKTKQFSQIQNDKTHFTSPPKLMAQGK